jgi:lipopolysaccharide/colanic/teichoic acid biosynthesis glycosyltransferase
VAGLKRGLDLGLASVAALVAAPILGAAMVGVAATMGRPVLFRQERPGRDGRPFEFLKLRTMRDAADAEGRSLPDHQRLTRFGRFLRSTSIDELPQLWNVIKGDMSLVGPRPLLMRYIPRYSGDQARRHEVLPGITGWVQINGRNALSWEDKFALDVWYVDHWTPLLDLKILALTVARVVSRRGISSEGHATMPEFMGTGNPPGP